MLCNNCVKWNYSTPSVNRSDFYNDESYLRLLNHVLLQMFELGSITYSQGLLPIDGVYYHIWGLLSIVGGSITYSWGLLSIVGVYYLQLGSIIYSWGLLSIDGGLLSIVGVYCLQMGVYYLQLGYIAYIWCLLSIYGVYYLQMVYITIYGKSIFQKLFSSTPHQDS